jgi:hypothetical protein
VNSGRLLEQIAVPSNRVRHCGLSGGAQKQTWPFRFVRRRGQNGENETNRFAKRNETLRDGGRKSLKLLEAPNQQFRGIVCFQWIVSRFVSHRSCTPLPRCFTVDAKPSAGGNPGIIANNSDNWD